MGRKKIAIVFGTRPEAIKMAPVIKEFQRHSVFFDVKVIVTAQHREMLDQVLNVFEITPDIDLNIMKENQTLSDITSKILKKLENIYIKEKFDMVLVHGDTTTSFSAALAAFYQKIPIGHVEAGLRTNDIYFPFPEEANRQLIDNLTELYFVPTHMTKENLLKENKLEEKIKVTGNTAIDALKYTTRLQVNHSIIEKMNNKRKWILLTMHRRENHGKPMENVFRTIKQIVKENQDVEVIMPVHLSPVVSNLANEFLKGEERIHLVGPLEVDLFHQVIRRSYLILTDSGGLQEEAPALDVPVLVLRNKTERPEGKKAGTLKVIGTDQQKVYDSVSELLGNSQLYQQMAVAKNPYGDGQASKRVVKRIKRYFNF